MPPPGSEPFLGAICENPADDAPRLVYADWLDEHGEPDRAEFIRVQIRLARADETGEDPGRLKARERVLRTRGESGWRKELPSLSGIQWQSFRRGFVDRVSVMHHKWLRASAPVVFAATPIQSLCVFGVNDSAAQEIARLPYLPRLEVLEVNEFARKMHQRGWMTIVECPGLTTLRELIIRGTRPDRRRWFDGGCFNLPVARLICSSPLYDRLDRLCLVNAAEPEAIDFLRTRFGARLEVWER
jgi:uncharacterized protein (TIGR02996 family)